MKLLRRAVFCLLALALALGLSACGQSAKYKDYVEEGNYRGGDALVYYDGKSYSTKYIPESYSTKYAENVRGVLRSGDPEAFEIYDMKKQAVVVTLDISPDDEEAVKSAVLENWENFLYWEGFPAALNGDYVPGSGIVLYNPDTDVYSVNPIPAADRPASLKDVAAVMTVTLHGVESYDITFTDPSGDLIYQESRNWEHMNSPSVEACAQSFLEEGGYDTVMQAIYDRTMAPVLEKGFVPDKGASGFLVYDGTHFELSQNQDAPADPQAVRYLIRNDRSKSDNAEVTDLRDGSVALVYPCTTDSELESLKANFGELSKYYLAFTPLQSDTFEASADAYGIIAYIEAENRYTPLCDNLKNEFNSAEEIRYIASKATASSSNYTVEDLVTGETYETTGSDSEELYYRLVATQMVSAKQTGSGRYLVAEKADEDGLYVLDNTYIPGEYKAASLEGALNVGGIVTVSSSYIKYSAVYNRVGTVTFEVESVNYTLRDVSSGAYLLYSNKTAPFSFPDYVTSYGNTVVSQTTYNIDTSEVRDDIAKSWAAHIA